MTLSFWATNEQCVINNFTIDETKTKVSTGQLWLHLGAIERSMVGDTPGMEHMYVYVASCDVFGHFRDAWKHCSSDIAFCLMLNIVQGVPPPAFNITAQRP